MYGHVVRMDDNRLPKRIFYGELATGKRTTGGQFKRFKDTLKASLKKFINPDTWENTAAVRTTWRSVIRRGAIQYEDNRLKKAEEKRAERKKKTNTETTIPNSTDFVCQICQRHFRTRIGLISHARTRKAKPRSWSSSSGWTNYIWWDFLVNNPSWRGLLWHF